MGSMCCGLRNPQKYKLQQLKMHAQEMKLLELIYSDLADRSINKQSNLQNFLTFFQKNCFWGEMLFEKFDSNQNKEIDLYSFMKGINEIFKKTQDQKISMLFNFFNNKEGAENEKDGVTFDNFKTMLYNYPKSDLKTVLNDRQFFQKEIKGNINVIRSTEYIQTNNKNKISQKQQNSLIIQFKEPENIQETQEENLPKKWNQRISSLKKIQNEPTSIHFQDGQQHFELKTHNLHFYVKKFAKRLFFQNRINRKNGKLSQKVFTQWIKKHKQLYDTYFNGFRNQIWQLDEMNQKCKYVNVFFDKRGKGKFFKNQIIESVQILLLHSMILLTQQNEITKCLKVICLQDLTVIQNFDKKYGYGIKITHRDGLYQKSFIYFENEQIRNQWRQTSICQSLSHPKLLKFKQSIKTKTELYIITELCKGKNLRSFIQDQGTFDQKSAALLMIQLIKGINYLHSMGIVHCDLKPDNIMVGINYRWQISFNKETHQFQSVKIIDFGLANFLSKIHDNPNSIGGTPNFIAPQVLNRQPITFQIDTFALGSTLYYMLSQTLPFDAYTLNEVYNRTKQGAYNFQSKIWKKASNQGKDFINQLLKTNPSQRINLKNLKQGLDHPWFEYASQQKNQCKIIIKQILQFFFEMIY